METTIIIIAILATIALALAIYILKKFRFKKILILLQTQQYEQFFKLADSGLSRYLFPRFNLEYLKLNANILMGEEKKINKSFETLFDLRMTQNQKDDVYMKAFNYYVGLEDKHKTKEMIEIIETFDNEAMKREARTIYDIFILKRANYIEEMEESIKDTPDEEKGITEYLLSVQYGNIKNKKKSAEYLALSKKHLTPPKDYQPKQ